MQILRLDHAPYQRRFQERSSRGASSADFRVLPAAGRAASEVPALLLAEESVRVLLASATGRSDCDRQLQIPCAHTTSQQSADVSLLDFIPNVFWPRCWKLQFSSSMNAVEYLRAKYRCQPVSSGAGGMLVDKTNDRTMLLRSKDPGLAVSGATHAPPWLCSVR